MKKEFYLLLFAFLVMLSAVAQAPFGKKFEPYYGQQGITKKVSELQTFSAASTVKKQPDLLFLKFLKFHEEQAKKFKKEFKSNSHESGTIRGGEKPGEDVMSELVLPGNNSTQQVWSNFLAADFAEFPFSTPPDPNGDVGPSQVVTLTNAGIKVFEKKSVTDPPIVSPKGIYNKPVAAQLFILLDQFFSPVLPKGSGTSDPHVRYDRLTKRWFVVAIEVTNNLHNNNILLAVSDGDRITDASSFIYYRFPAALFPYSGKEPNAPLLDYPTLGVDKNAVLIGGNAFFFHLDDCGNDLVDSLYSVGYAIDKKMLIHGHLTVNALKLGSLDFHKGTGGGIYTPQGVQNDDPSATKSFFAGISNVEYALVLANLTYNNDGKLTALTETAIPVAPFQLPRDVTAPGSPMPIDPNDTKLLAAAIYKNKLTGKSGLWTAHAIGVNQSGGFVPDSIFVQQARTGSRWYEIGDIYSKPHLTQSGNVYDPLQASGRRASMYFNPSIAANGQGHAVLSGTTAAFNKYLNVFLTGRYNGDAPGTMGTPEKVTNTTALYALVYGNYFGRWGDFSQTVVDPVDDQTIWTFQEYANADDSYGLRAVQVKAPPPATPLPLVILSNKSDTIVTLQGISIDNSGFFDPGSDKGGPGYNRLTVKSTGNILVSNIKFISPTKISFKLNTKNKPAGKYTLVITNPDGQFVVTDFIIVPQWLNSIVGAGTQLSDLAQKYITSSSVHPNPAHDEFKLQINAAKDIAAKVIVMDVSGKQLYENKYNFNKGNNEVSLSLANYDKGTYIAAVYNQYNNLIALQKIIKQ